MKQYTVGSEPGFKLYGGTRRSEAALFVLRSGQSSGAGQEVHRGSDQWVYILSGTGRVTVGERALEVGPRDLLCIEAGEPHEITATGSEPLETLSVYAPPEYGG